MWTDPAGQIHAVEQRRDPPIPAPEELRLREGRQSGWKGTASCSSARCRRRDTGSVQLNHEAVYLRRQGAAGCSASDEPAPAGTRTSSGRWPTRTPTSSTCRACATTAPSWPASPPARQGHLQARRGWHRPDRPGQVQGHRMCNLACPYDKVYFNPWCNEVEQVHLLLPAPREGRRTGLRAPVRAIRAVGYPGRPRGPDRQAGEEMEGGAAAASPSTAPGPTSTTCRRCCPPPRTPTAVSPRTAPADRVPAETFSARTSTPRSRRALKAEMARRRRRAVGTGWTC